MSGETIRWIAGSVAAVLATAAICVACVIGNGAADHHKVQMVRACVAAGDQWVRGDCVRTR